MKPITWVVVALSFFFSLVTSAFAAGERLLPLNLLSADGLFVRTNETECNAIRHKTANRTLCLDLSEGILRLYDGTGWPKFSLNPSPEVFVDENDSYLTIAGPYHYPVNFAQLRIGKDGVTGNNSLEVTGEVSAPGTVSSVFLKPRLTPANNSAETKSPSGDAYGLAIRPSINISEHSTGPIGVKAHKFVASQHLSLPRLCAPRPVIEKCDPLKDPQLCGCSAEEYAAWPGKPQSLFGLWITDPFYVDPPRTVMVEDALAEAWALMVSTTLGSKFSGAVQIGHTNSNPDSTAQALVEGSGFGRRRNHMLLVTGRMQPFALKGLGDQAHKSGESFAARIEADMNTDRDKDDVGNGTFPYIGTLSVATPTITKSGLTPVATFTTLKVGDAPKVEAAGGVGPGFASTVRRALWVGTGQSEIEGPLKVKSVNVTESLNVTGSLTKGSGSFVQPHPSDPAKEMVYAFFEGPEHAVFLRGKAKLVAGSATIETPDHFRVVAGKDEDITVQLTPRYANTFGLAAVRVTKGRVEVRELKGGTNTYEFDYFITAKRAGFEEHEPIQPNRHFTADMKTAQDFERAYETTDDLTIHALRNLLISNGILTNGGKLNRETAARLGWTVKEAEVIVRGQ